MAGIRIFRDMDEAIKAGFRVLEKRDYGYDMEISSARPDGQLVRSLAFVVLNQQKFELAQRPQRLAMAL